MRPWRPPGRVLARPRPNLSPTRELPGARIPGGSSGGSGAAVTARLTAGAIGTDTAGSIRIPSALCGGVDLKPTYGRVSKRGVTQISQLYDHVGPMTRTVEDTAIILQAIAGYGVALRPRVLHFAGASSRGAEARSFITSKVNPEVLLVVVRTRSVGGLD